MLRSLTINIDITYLQDFTITFNWSLFYHPPPILEVSWSMNNSRKTIVNMKKDLNSDVNSRWVQLKKWLFRIVLSSEGIAVCLLLEYFLWYDCLFNLYKVAIVLRLAVLVFPFLVNIIYSLEKIYRRGFKSNS